MGNSRINLYPAETATSINRGGSLDLWATNASGNEIDLRDEFHKFLYGSGSETAKGQRGILRRMNVDDDGELVVCPCVSDTTLEPDLDNPCPYCHSERYIWTEEWIVYYCTTIGRGDKKANAVDVFPAGIYADEIKYFYLEHGVEPSKVDKIIEVDRDVDGNIEVPIVRVAKYSIGTIEPMRSDNGRVEFYRIAAVKDQRLAKWDQ